MIRFVRLDVILQEKQRRPVAQATHIFDGLESWPTHLMYLADGRLKAFEPASSFQELREGRLLFLVEKYATTRTLQIYDPYGSSSCHFLRFEEAARLRCKASGILCCGQVATEGSCREAEAAEEESSRVLRRQGCPVQRQRRVE